MESNSKLSMKILIDRKGKRVLFAEADKDVVDFMCNFSSSMNLDSLEGCMGKLYGSVENLNKNGYASSSSTTRALYRCPNAEILDRSRNHVYYPNSCKLYVSDNPEAICPRHRIKLTQQLAYVKANGGMFGNGGKVKGGVTYMIMDDLEVKVIPESSFQITALLRKLHVRDLGTLEVKDVNMTDIEVLKIMEASLESDTILTDVFLERPCFQT